MVCFIAVMCLPVRAVSTAGPSKRTVTLAAVGDVMMARGVESECRRHGWDYPFAKIGPELRRTDIAVGNLECTLSRTGTKLRRRYSLRGSLLSLPALRRSGFTLLSQANNHANDYGPKSLQSTLNGLRRNGIRPVGASLNARQVWRGVVVHRRGLRIGFLGCDTFTLQEGVPSTSGPAIATLNEPALLAAIRRLRRRTEAVVVVVHWGIEGITHHDHQQQALGRRMIDAGACLILGSHPHLPQDIERYHTGVIVYSLGNCIFDEFSHPGPSGLLFTCRISASGVIDYRTRRLKIRDCRPTFEGPPVPARSTGQTILKRRPQDLRAAWRNFTTGNP